MNQREKLLGLGKLYLSRGEPIPLDLLAQADSLGLSIEDFGEPSQYQDNDDKQSEKDSF